MKTRIIHIILFIGLLNLQNPCLKAQNENEVSFTSVPEQFIMQLRNYFEANQGQAYKSSIKQFEDFTELHQVEEDQWIIYRDIANLMAGMKAKPKPFFLNFLDALISLGSASNNQENIVLWAEEVFGFIDGANPSLNQVNEFFLFTSRLYDKHILFLSPTVEWKYSSNKVVFGRDTAFYLLGTNTNLTGIAGRDSSIIRNTNGKYYPLHKQWIGNDGKLTWQKVGLPDYQVYVELPIYRLDLNSTVFSIDSVNLIDARYFKEPIAGRLEEKISVGVSPDRAGYPRFVSYENHIQIKAIYPNMDYQGGFTLEGRKVVGSGSNEGKGELTIFQNQRPQMRLASNYFVFNEDRARGINTEASIYLETDSIFHPGLLFQYQAKRNELALMRDGQGLSNSRFFDTYHQFDMNVEMMIWRPGDSLLTMSGMVGSLENKAAFESTDFFSFEKWNTIQVADLVHPLVAIKNCSEYYYSRGFTSGELSEFMKRPKHLVEEMLLNVSFLGFVRFNSETDMVEVQQKTFDFIAKHAGNQDYDIIRFESLMEPPNPNAILSLNTSILTVYGVPFINFSSTRGVKAFPSNNSVKLFKGRKIEFDGYVDGGLLRFEAHHVQFNYPDYNLYMDSIDQIKINVHIPLDENYQQTQIVAVTSVIENTAGTLFIDSPDNKAGLNPDIHFEYPMFKADTSAYVYWDQSFIQRGAYTRDSFYFSTDSLVLKGLNSLHLKDSLHFAGTLVTAGIFPPINIELRYHDDHSLGFETFYTPPEGYPVYHGKGTFYDQISMNNDGLMGNGKLEYLDATLVSDNILFLPDRVKTQARSLAINKESSTRGNPNTAGQDLAITWEPAKDQMIATQEDGILKLYDNVDFDGKVFVEPDGLKGSGTLRIDNFIVTSDTFNFYQEGFLAKKSQFWIQSGFVDSLKQANDLAYDFIAHLYNAEVDLNQHKTLFLPAVESAYAELPINKYQVRGDSIVWDMGANRIQLMNPKFKTAHPSQGNLQFPAAFGLYNLDEYTVGIDQISDIRIGDAVIIPGGNKTYLRANAILDSFPNATIVPADSVRHSHRIVNAMVRIKGEKSYEAYGSYIYTDKAGRELKLPLYQISSTAGLSQGSGRISADKPFYLSPEFVFQGKVNWSMNEDLLSFSGGIQLTHDCPNITKSWIKIEQAIDPENVKVPVNSVMRDLAGERIYAGFFLSNQPVDLYSTFLGPHLTYSDQVLTSSEGYMYFDYDSGIYKIIDTTSITDPIRSNAALSLSRDACLVTSEGKMGLGVDFGQFTYEAAGQINHVIPSDSIYLNIILGLDFMMNDKALSFMTRSINDTRGLKAINYSEPAFQKALQELLGEARGKDLINQMGLMGGFRKLPDELEHTLFITQLNMSWNPETESYVSNGQIGIGNIGNKAINKMVPGRLEIVHRRAGDSFNLYLEPEPNNYFFFTYSRGLMQVIAGPKFEKFNSLVRDTKAAKRQADEQPGQAAYQYYIGQYRLVQNFLSKFTGQ